MPPSFQNKIRPVSSGTPSFVAKAKPVSQLGSITPISSSEPAQSLINSIWSGIAGAGKAVAIDLPIAIGETGQNLFAGAAKGAGQTVLSAAQAIPNVVASVGAQLLKTEPTANNTDTLIEKLRTLPEGQERDNLVQQIRNQISISSQENEALKSKTAGLQKTLDIGQVTPDILKPEGTAQNIGYGAEKLAEFFIPSGGIIKANKVIDSAINATKLYKTGIIGKAAGELLKIGSRAGIEALATAGVTAGQKGTSEDIINNAEWAATIVGGIGVAGLAAEPIGNLFQSAARKIYSSAAKFSTAGKGGAKKAAANVETGLKEGIRLSEQGMAKTISTIDDLETELGKTIDKFAKKGEKVPTWILRDYVDEAKKWFGDIADVKEGQKAIQEIDDIYKNFVDKYGDFIDIKEAQKVKVATYQWLKKSYGRISTASDEASKQLVRGLKEGIVDIAPQAGEINARLKSLYHFDEALSRSLGRFKNLNLLGLGTKAMGSIALGTHNPVLEVLTFANEFLGKPLSKSGASIYLYRLGEALKGVPPEFLRSAKNLPVIRQLYQRLTGEGLGALSAEEKVIAKQITDYLDNPKLGLSIEDISKKAEGGIPNKLPQVSSSDLGTSLTSKTSEHLADAKVALQKAKGLSAQDIMNTYPDIQLKRDVPATDIHGNKIVIPEGEALTPYELKGNKILLQDGETYIVSKNQFQNIKGQSISGEAKPFAPELKGTEETVRGSLSDKQKNVGQQNLKIMEDRQKEILELADTKYNGELPENLRNEYTDLGDKIEYLQRGLTSSDTTKFSQYQLPGGKNYKEVLIKAKPETFAGVKMQDLTDEQLAKINEPGFKSSHWDEPNVISHLRLNERTYKGKKVTFMEELQSDWAREVRQSPILNKLPEDIIVKKRFNGLGEQDGYYVYEKQNTNNIIGEGKTVEEAKTDAINYYNKKAPPSNPLLKNWQELSVKRALKEAVDNNSEYLAWISGEQTSARYNLSTHLKNAEWKTTSGQGGKRITLQKQEGGELSFLMDKDGTIKSAGGGVPENWIGQKLDSVIGKGLADKIMAQEKGNLSGEGLSFGGEWAKNLYDKQVKNIVEDVTGGKVEVIDMGLPVDNKVPSFDLIQPSGKRIAKLTPDNLEVGAPVSNAKGDYYIITDILGDGKFKAVEKWIIDAQYKPKYSKGVTMQDRINSVKENESQHIKTFDISTKKSSGQQAVRLTDDIKRMVRGEAPKIKASGKSPFIK